MSEFGTLPYDPIAQEPRTLGEFEQAVAAIELAVRHGIGQVPDWSMRSPGHALDRLIAYYTHKFGKELTGDNAAQLVAEFVLRVGVSSDVARATSIQDAVNSLAPAPIPPTNASPHLSGVPARPEDQPGRPAFPGPTPNTAQAFMAHSSLHDVIDHLDRWLEVLRRFRMASTPEEVRAAIHAWLRRRQSWPPGLSADDAVSNTRNTMTSWCRHRGHDGPESRAIIEESAKCAADLAMYCPLSAFHFYETPSKHEARWQRQTEFLEWADNAFVGLRRLADIMGEHWEHRDPASSGHWGMAPSPPAPEVDSASNRQASATAASGKVDEGSLPILSLSEVPAPSSPSEAIQRRPQSVEDLVRFRCSVLDATYARLLLAGYVWARLDATLRRAHGHRLPESYASGAELPRTFDSASEGLRDALTRLAEFAEVPPAFPWLRCGEQVWTLAGASPDLEGWLATAAALDADDWEAKLLVPFRVCSESVSRQIDEFARQFEVAKEACIAASDCRAETRLELTGALQNLRSWQETRSEQQERNRKRLHDELSAAIHAMGSLSHNESADEASRRRTDRLLALGLEITLQEWQEWFRVTAAGDPLTREIADMLLKGDPEPLERATRRLPTAKADFERLQEWLKRVAKEWPTVHDQGWLRWQLCHDLPVDVAAAPASNVAAKPNALEIDPFQERKPSVIDSDVTHLSDCRSREGMSDEQFEEWARQHPGPAARVRKVRDRHTHMASAVSHGEKTPEGVLQFVKAIAPELVIESGKEINARRMWNRFKKDPRYNSGANA